MTFRTVALAAALLMMLCSPLAADKGVGVTLGAIEMQEPLKPGRQYQLPPIGIINSGDARDTYRFGMSLEDKPNVKKMNDSWLDFDPPTMELNPGETRQVKVELTVPSGARAGDYDAFIEAIAGSKDDMIQAGAGTRLSFTVAEAGWLEIQRNRVSRWLDDASPWPYVVAVAGLGVVLLRWSSRRVRFRLPFEPR